MFASGWRTMIDGSSSSWSLVSINPEGSHDYPSRDPRALASGGLSLLLALEIASTAAMDLVVVPTIGFDLLYALIIVRLDREASSGSTSRQTPPQNGSRAS
jgi:hypothetical protein